MATRRGNLTLLGFVIAALIGVALLAIPAVAAPPRDQARPRPPGRRRARAQGDPAQGRGGHRGEPRPRDRGHPEPRRRARCRRAGDPAAGQGPDLDPAPGRRRCRQGRRADRQDRPALALRRQREHARPDPRRERLPGPGRGPVPAPEGAPAPDEDRRDPRVLPRRSEGEEGDLRPRGLRGADPHGVQDAHGEGGPEGVRDLGHPGEDDHPLVRRRRALLPGRQRSASDSQLLLPLPVRPGEQGEARPGDDGRRPEAGRHPQRLQPDRRRDRPHGVHGRRRRQVPRRHARHRPARAAALGPGRKGPGAPGLRDRPRPGDQVGADDRLGPKPGRHRRRLGGDHRHR